MANLRPDTSHLKPWQPGQSGNPGGRRKRVLSDRYAELMESLLPDEIRKAMKLPAGALWGDAIALVSARTALRPNEVGVAQRKELRESIEGKAPQRFEVRQDGEVEFHIVYEEPLVKRRIEDEKKTIDVKQLAPGADESES